MSLLVVQNLIKNYTNGTLVTEVLKDISFNIEEGDFMMIIGSSGSGKTTLLNCISGLEKITGGIVKLNDKNLANIKEKEMAHLRRKNIGFVFQAYNLLPNLTLYENVAIASIIAGNENKDRILELLEKFNLLEFKDYFPDQVSGGMQQRCAIVRSLINDPEIIFADEPTGNLDSVSSKEVMENFAFLHKTYNKTIVMVTHSLDNLKYANRYIRIIDGKIVEDIRLLDE
ncbi:MAG: ABC transporter ATP-binding protein [Bacilli bacterium]|nr:ABC transporter ATP-binding protein [Bacilli bacterium]